MVHTVHTTRHKILTPTAPPGAPHHTCPCMGCGPARIALVAGHGYVRITQYTLVQLPRSAPAHPSFCFSLTTHPHPHLGLYGRYARSRPRRLYESAHSGMHVSINQLLGLGSAVMTVITALGAWVITCKALARHYSSWVLVLPARGLLIHGLWPNAARGVKLLEV